MIWIICFKFKNISLISLGLCHKNLMIDLVRLATFNSEDLTFSSTIFLFLISGWSNWSGVWRIVSTNPVTWRPPGWTSWAWSTTWSTFQTSSSASRPSPSKSKWFEDFLFFDLQCFLPDLPKRLGHKKEKMVTRISVYKRRFKPKQNN